MRMFGRWRKRPPVIQPGWRAILEERVALWRDLQADQQQRMLERTAAFVADRRWEGIGLDVDNTIRLVIGAHAALLGLGFDRDPFDRVTSIVVYPTTVVRRGSRHLGGGVAATGPMAIHGETARGGPVVIVWRAADIAARHPERGRNVVLHEFAHQLDMADGVVDGMPPLRDRSSELAWQAMMADVYARLIEEVDPFLGRYATTNHGELFAVASERFFTRPDELGRRHPDLYSALQSFYRQDPATRRAD